jgi:hypothetical protein
MVAVDFIMLFPGIDTALVELGGIIIIMPPSLSIEKLCGSTSL